MVGYVRAARGSWALRTGVALIVIEGTGPHDAGALLAAVCGVATHGSVGCYRCAVSRGPNEGPGLRVRAEAGIMLCYVMLPVPVPVPEPVPTGTGTGTGPVGTGR